MMTEAEKQSRFDRTYTILCLIIVLMLVVAVAIKRAEAGDFGDAATTLEQQIDQLSTDLDTLTDRVQDLEDGSTSPEPDPPDEIPPPVVGIEPGQDPFIQHRIPGYIQAEDYDLGGNGTAYMDFTSGNVGGAYRTDDVDIKRIESAASGYQLGWNRDTEWLEYTVGAIAGNYDLHLRVASNVTEPGSLRVYISNQVVAQIAIPNTGGWSVFTTLIVRDVNIAESANIMLKLEILGGPFDVDWMRFVSKGQTANRAPMGVITCEDGLSNCENAAGESVICLPDATNTYCLSVI